MDFHDIRPSVFLTLTQVARFRSFTAAAKELGVSQSAVSQTVEKLEKKLGCTLFQREFRPLRLTREGEQVLCGASRFIDEVVILQNSLNQQERKEVTSLKIGISEVAAGFFSEALEMHFVPRLQSLEVRTSLIPQVLEDFANGLLDIAIAPDIPERAGRLRIPLAKENYFAVCARQYETSLAAFEKEDAFGRINLPFISYRANSADRRKAQSYLRRIGLNSNVCFELENTQAVVKAVENGLGWTILPPMNIVLGKHIERLSVRKILDDSMQKSLFVATDRPVLKAQLEEIAEIFNQNFRSLILQKDLTVLKGLSSGFSLAK